MVEVTTDEQQASSQCFPLLLWLHFIWLSFLLSYCSMEKTKVERDFPQHLSSQHQSSRQCHLRDLPKKSQCKMLSFTSKVQFFVFFYPYSVIVCQKNSSRLLFPFFTMSAPFRHIQRHKREGCILYLQQCTNSYLLLHRTHYGRLDTMKNFLDYCLLHFQTLDGVSNRKVFSRLIIAFLGPISEVYTPLTKLMQTL